MKSKIETPLQIAVIVEGSNVPTNARGSYRILFSSSSRSKCSKLNNCLLSSSIETFLQFFLGNVHSRHLNTLWLRPDTMNLFSPKNSIDLAVVRWWRRPSTCPMSIRIVTHLSDRKSTLEVVIWKFATFSVNTFSGLRFFLK
jgi:hypothetical protein